MYHCLFSPSQGYLRDHQHGRVDDHSQLWTADPASSLRFLDQDEAVARIRSLGHLGLDVQIKLVSFSYASAGQWIPES